MRKATSFAANVIGLASIPREEHAIELSYTCVKKCCKAPGPAPKKSGWHSRQRSLSGMPRHTIALRGIA